jgi:hypothetical protein
LPEPKEDWDYSILLFNKMGDCYFEFQEYGSSDYFHHQVLCCNDGLASAEAWLGIGKSRYEKSSRFIFKLIYACWRRNF